MEYVGSGHHTNVGVIVVEIILLMTVVTYMFYLYLLSLLILSLLSYDCKYFLYTIDLKTREALQEALGYKLKHKYVYIF